VSKQELGPNLVGQIGCIQRTFCPRSNAQAMLVTGGEALAAHASFDPDYKRAQGWIRHHAVGPATLSPILIGGLIGALVEAAFPQAVVVRRAMEHVRPLIVGTDVQAQIEVIRVVNTMTTPTLPDLLRRDERRGERRDGYQACGGFTQGQHATETICCPLESCATSRIARRPSSSLST
jgi:hypothetical protein